MHTSSTAAVPSLHPFDILNATETSDFVAFYQRCKTFSVFQNVLALSDLSRRFFLRSTNEARLLFTVRAGASLRILRVRTRRSRLHPSCTYSTLKAAGASAISRQLDYASQIAGNTNNKRGKNKPLGGRIPYSNLDDMMLQYQRSNHIARCRHRSTAARSYTAVASRVACST